MYPLMTSGAPHSASTLGLVRSPGASAPIVTPPLLPPGEDPPSPPSSGEPSPPDPSSSRYIDDKNRPVLRTAISDPTTDVVTPPTPDQANNFYCSQGLSRSFYQQPPIGRPRRASWHADTGSEPAIDEFFSVRVGALEQAVEECQHLTDPLIDGAIKGAWLLTEINHWDIEKERVVILCDLSLLVVKYDFIALRHIEFTRICLTSLENLQIGELTYPSHSLVPRINGIAGGVVTVIRSCLLSRLQNTIATLGSRATGAPSSTQKESVPENQFSLSTVSFEPRARNMQGFRVTWNNGHQISFAQKWNPWSRDIPYTTFTSHPLYWYTGCENATYDAKSLAKELKLAIENFQERPDTAATCSVSQSPIIIENYVGIASLLHNATELGFFKLRGKVSF
ncbi:tumor protein p63-regulated gene 1-like protein isoform X2 [Procambarus clarkii]|uniref:tumor protein p63-regulated gene 1-like protein isoform X2 n=1 Tax=Procambarus clarkii TaxID=6728 RepID=UPI001E678F8B|nr:tumor protein p63-regulated gene 1-like protein isoform X2 [Procambarus clarkii]